MEKEKWVQINKIQGYEEIKDCYWISNSDEDKIFNENIGRMMKISLNRYGYETIGLVVANGKKKVYRIHTIKCKAFIYTPNLINVNIIRHLNDIKTDNRLENLTWGTTSDNIKDSIRNDHYSYEGSVKGGTIASAITAKKTSKPVRCIETGIIYSSIHEVSHQLGIRRDNIRKCCNGKRKTVKGLHWEFVNKEELEEVNKNASKH